MSMRTAPYLTALATILATACTSQDGKVTDLVLTSVHEDTGIDGTYTRREGVWTFHLGPTGVSVQSERGVIADIRLDENRRPALVLDGRDLSSALHGDDVGAAEVVAFGQSPHGTDIRKLADALYGAVASPEMAGRWLVWMDILEGILDDPASSPLAAFEAAYDTCSMAGCTGCNGFRLFGYDMCFCNRCVVK